MSRNLRAILRESYDRRAEERDAKPAPDWELRERGAFCELLRRERRHSVLDLGAATGTDAEFFRENGLDAVCVDLSPEMIRRCREKGLRGHVMHLTDLRFPEGSFDAAYAENSLVHLPKAELPAALRRISPIVMPGGLFYVALDGGYEFEGEGEWDTYDPRVHG